MNTITLINQKGGCGKSSTCFHLAGAFARLELQVLLVDLDPQGSLSQGVFGSQFVERLEAGMTTAALFHESFLPVDNELVQPTPWPGISICPANQRLGVFNVPAEQPRGLSQFAVREFLERQSHFDIVLIDCPPNLYRCSWAAMVAADDVVIPVPPEDFGTQGLRAVHQAIDNARLINPHLELLGHLVTRSDRRLLIHREYEERLRSVYGPLVLETVIPEAVAFKVALACRQPVEFYGRRTPAANLTRCLAHEILERIATKTAVGRIA